MKNYERPQVFCQEDLCEGVYLASGDEVCKSIYIQGTCTNQTTVYIREPILRSAAARDARQITANSAR